MVQIGQKLEIGKNDEILVNSVKVAFSGIQNGKTQPFFQDERLEILYAFSPASASIHVLRFLKIPKNENFGKLKI